MPDNFTPEDIEELASVLCAALPDVTEQNRAKHWKSRGKDNQYQWRRVATAAAGWCGYGVDEVPGQAAGKG